MARPGHGKGTSVENNHVMILMGDEYIKNVDELYLEDKRINPHSKLVWGEIYH